MNLTRQLHRTRRLAAVLAALAAILLASATPAALARSIPPPPAPAASVPAHPAAAPVHLPPLPPGWNKHPPLPGPARAHSAAGAGMPRWQVILIVAGAAALAAAAMLTDPAQAKRRHRGAPGT